jgi:hypothetical protein
MVQEDKKVKPKRKFTLKEPPAPVPINPKPIKPSPKTTKPQSDSKPPQSQNDSKPPQSQTNSKPPQPQTNSKSLQPQTNSKPSQPQSNSKSQKPPPITTNKILTSTLTVPKIRDRSRSPAKSPAKHGKPPAINTKSPGINVIEEEDEEAMSESTTKIDSPRLLSPVGSENSAISAITIQSDVILKTRKSSSGSKSSFMTISESPRSISPIPIKKSNTLKEQSPARKSRPKSKSPIGRGITINPSSKELTRPKSPNFTERQPRTLKRSSSVTVPRKSPRILRRAQTVAPPPFSPPLSPPCSESSRKSVYKPIDRRYSTSYINSAMQINAQSSFAGLWSNTFDRSREDPTKKIIDELLSLFMETYEINPNDSLLKTIKEFLENQKEETSKIFDWLLTTQLSLQYKILLGYFYLNGIGTSVENRKAFVLFLSAARKQYAIAQDLLGSCYLNGKGTVKDEILAFEWYQKAAANGSVTAFQNLGECYHYGYGSVKNKSKALQYFKSSSDGGNVCGKNMLGLCYEMGLGISPDHRKAFYFYRQAADAGYKLAQQNVAKCYQKGVGVAIDLKAADYWLEKSNQE